MPKILQKLYIVLLIYIKCTFATNTDRDQHFYTESRKLELREDVRKMFQHAYDSYLRYAANYDELRPLTCDGQDTWGSYSLTLIDALDTLVTMGNFSEFRRVAALLEKSVNFDRDINVSVFETNIRIVGGLLSAHLLSKRAGAVLETGWPCQGPLLRMAEDVAKRLLPAFDTATGMPYGTVNLRYGVPKGETPITCTAGVGTFLVEFGALSRLTGNDIYENVALNAIYALWERRSPIGLFGNHIDVQTGRWTALDSGIGAGVDSFFEYLVKGSILLNRPDLLKMFQNARQQIDKYLRKDDWYVWVGMNKGHVTLPVFQSLESFWPGILSMVGDQGPALRTMSKYVSVWNKYGFLPEFFNIPTGEAAVNREVYPLRPELVESAMYLYRATKNQMLLELGEHMLETLEFSAKTRCGYATIRNVVTHEKENRMESFFLAETTKYLYLLFDEDNFLHKDGTEGSVIETNFGSCIADAGAYIFNTEAHPIDMSALYCCHDINEDIFNGLDINAYKDKVFLKRDNDKINARTLCGNADDSQPINENDAVKTKIHTETNIAVDIQVYDEFNQPAADTLLANFERIKQERELERKNEKAKLLQRNQLTINDIDEFFTQKPSQFKTPTDVLIYVQNFMRNYTLDPAFIRGLKILDRNVSNILGKTAQNEFENVMHTLWDLYELRQRYAANVRLIRRLGLISNKNTNVTQMNITDILDVLEQRLWNETSNASHTIRQAMSETRLEYELSLVNTTAMQEFLYRIYKSGTTENIPPYTPWLNASQLQNLQVRKVQSHEDLEFFFHTRRVVHFKKRMEETVQRLQNLMDDNREDKPLANQEQVQEEQPKSNKVADADVIPEAVEPTPTANEIKENIENTPKGTEITEENNSMWSQLVQTILRQTVVKRNKFDEHVLREKVAKSLRKYEQQEMPYEMYTCPRPQFVETFAYRDNYPNT